MQDSDAGVYKDEAANSHGKADTEAKVGIKDAKDVFALLKGKEKALKPGEEPSFTWFKGGAEFDPDERFKFCSRMKKTHSPRIIPWRLCSMD